MPPRVATDLALATAIQTLLPEYALLMGRLHHDRFLTPSDSELMRETQRVLEDAAGRLMLRMPEDVK